MSKVEDDGGGTWPSEVKSIQLATSVYRSGLVDTAKEIVSFGSWRGRKAGAEALFVMSTDPNAFTREAFETKLVHFLETLLKFNVGAAIGEVALSPFSWVWRLHEGHPVVYAMNVLCILACRIATRCEHAERKFALDLVAKHQMRIVREHLGAVVASQKRALFYSIWFGLVSPELSTFYGPMLTQTYSDPLTQSIVEAEYAWLRSTGYPLLSLAGANMLLASTILRSRVQCCLRLALTVLHIRNGYTIAAGPDDCVDTAAFKDFEQEDWHDIEFMNNDGLPSEDTIMQFAWREPDPRTFLPLWHVALTSHPEFCPVKKLPDVVSYHRHHFPFVHIDILNGASICTVTEVASGVVRMVELEHISQGLLPSAKKGRKKPENVLSEHEYIPNKQYQVTGVHTSPDAVFELSSVPEPLMEMAKKRETHVDLVRDVDKWTELPKPPAFFRHTFAIFGEVILVSAPSNYVWKVHSHWGERTIQRYPCNKDSTDMAEMYEKHVDKHRKCKGKRDKTYRAHVGFRYILPSGEERTVNVGDEYTVRHNHVTSHRRRTGAPRDD